MMLLAAVLVAASVFFACLGVWAAAHRPRLLSEWPAELLRPRFRPAARRARLRSIR